MTDKILKLFETKSTRNFILLLLFLAAIGACESKKDIKIKQSINALSDESNDIRMTAVKALGEIDDPRVIDPLIKTLSDKDSQVKKAALDALIDIGPPAVEFLIKALSEEKLRIREGAAEALGKIGDPRAVEPLIKALNDKTTRIKVAKALGKIGDPRAVDPLMKTFSYDGKHDQYDAFREKTIEALGEIGDPRAVDPLTQVLSDESNNIRMTAVKALGEIGDSRAIEPLIKVFRDKDSQVKKAAIESLIKIGTPAVEFLNKALSDESMDVRVAAVKALGEIGDSRAIEALIKHLSMKDPYFYRYPREQHSAYDAYWILRGIGRPAVEFLNKALSNRIVLIRQSAAELLGEIGDPRAVEHLIKALNDERIQDTVAEALGKIGDPRAVDPLMKTFSYDGKHDQYDAFREKTIEALGEIGDPRAVELLIKVLNDNYHPIREDAAEALGKIGDPRAVEPLIKALGKISDPTKTINPLTKMLDDSGSSLRWKAADALGNIDNQKAKFYSYLDNNEIEKAIKIEGALELCLEASTCNYWGIRGNAFVALGIIGNKKVTPTLVNALADWGVKKYALTGLRKLKWQPSSDEEKIHAYVAAEDTPALLRDWEITRRVLLNDAASGNIRKTKYAVYALTAIGNDEVLDKIIYILNKHGDKEMAEYFLNCGNKRLSEAGTDWAYKNGYQVLRSYSGGSGKWGEWD